jgi:hypothetical protein
LSHRWSPGLHRLEIYEATGETLGLRVGGLQVIERMIEAGGYGIGSGTSGGGRSGSGSGTTSNNFKDSGTTSNKDGSKTSKNNDTSKKYEQADSKQKEDSPLDLNSYLYSNRPISVIDGGFTDNTGIGRAVMEGATHISAIGYYASDVASRFLLGKEDSKTGNFLPDKNPSKLFLGHSDGQAKCFKTDVAGMKLLLDCLRPVSSTGLSQATGEIVDEAWGETKTQKRDDSSIKLPSKQKYFTVDYHKEFDVDVKNTKLLKRLHMIKLSDVEVLQGSMNAFGERKINGNKVV